VLLDGDHTIDSCFEASEATLKETFAQLARQGVAIEGILLKPSMVTSGNKAVNRADPEAVAERTVECFKRVIPASLPGVIFLSGGQGDEEATLNLNAINQRAAIVGAPWEYSFSFGRGLQGAPLKAWSGQAANVQLAKQAFYHRAKLTSAARNGVYDSAMEKELSAV
jgi:fructose-bisphosphate aldolase class I